VADKVLAVALVPLLVVVLTGIGVVLAALYDCSGDTGVWATAIRPVEAQRRSTLTLSAAAD
jgi:hypothetical protein